MWGEKKPYLKENLKSGQKTRENNDQNPTLPPQYKINTMGGSRVLNTSLSHNLLETNVNSAIFSEDDFNSFNCFLYV